MYVASGRFIRTTSGFERVHVSNPSIGKYIQHGTVYTVYSVLYCTVCTYAMGHMAGVEQAKAQGNFQEPENRVCRHRAGYACREIMCE